MAVSTEDIEFTLRGHEAMPWSDFLLNPRRLRGSDFLMRWSQGVWSEERLTAAINASEEFHALAYGPSGVAPEEVREYELYFERLEAAGLGRIKRPDLLIFPQAERQSVAQIVAALGGSEELPFTSEDDARMRELLSAAIIAVECENSLWASGMMPAYGKPLRAQKRLGGKWCIREVRRISGVARITSRCTKNRPPRSQAKPVKRLANFPDAPVSSVLQSPPLFRR